MEETALTIANQSSQASTLSHLSPTFTTIVPFRPAPQYRQSTQPSLFLLLAAELRNRIYEYALLHDRRYARTANVALLRTCKQVYHEALAYLYDCSTLSISAHVLLPTLTCQTSFRGDWVHELWGQPSSLAAFAVKWPPHFARVKRLHLAINFRIPSHGRLGSGDFVVINHFLYALVAFLNENPLPGRNLTICFPADGGNFVSQRSIATILFPALKLPLPVWLVLENVHAEIAAHVQMLRARVLGWPTATFAPFGFWQRVKDWRDGRTGKPLGVRGHNERVAAETAFRVMESRMIKQRCVEWQMEREMAETVMSVGGVLDGLGMAVP